MECHEYRAAKRAKDRARMENKEVRDRKRAMDMERRKIPEVAARQLKAGLKYAQTDKYKELTAKRTRDERAQWLIDNSGKVCSITSVKCLDCGDVGVYPSYKVDHLRLKSKYCKLCAKNHSQYEGVVIKKIDITCVDCGELCRGAKNKKVCDTCRKARIRATRGVQRKTNPNDIARRKEYAKMRGNRLSSRARRRGCYVDVVNVDLVYKRDGYRCVSCRCKVERTRHYQPNRATIDHRIPLSRGGSHTYENCQTMCVMCNSKKEASMPVSVQLSVFDMVSTPIGLWPLGM
jgi:5-methylcytosine-specific restriction endonuclease McrA